MKPERVYYPAGASVHDVKPDDNISPYILAHRFPKFQTIYLNCFLKYGADTFRLDLMGGTPMKTDDSAGFQVLYIKGDFPDQQLWINSRGTSGWAKHFAPNLALRDGTTIDIRIRALENTFEIRIDHKKILDYEYVLPLDYVEYVNVYGPITIERAYIAGQKFDLPYTIDFPEGYLNIDDHLIINAIPIDDKPTITFFTAKNSIAMQLVIDFENRVVVRNAQINGRWGEAERDGNFPFEKDVEFELEIQNAEHGFVFSVNGQRFATFAHRISDPANNYVSLEINGRIEPTNLAICKGSEY